MSHNSYALQTIILKRKFVDQRRHIYYDTVLRDFRLSDDLTVTSVLRQTVWTIFTCKTIKYKIVHG